MFYLFMFLFFAAIIVLLVSLIIFVLSKSKRKRQKKVMLASFMVGVSSLIIGLIIGSPEPEPVMNETIIDVTQFSKISPDELVKILGEPKEKENWQFDNGIKKFDTTTYKYCDGNCEFHIIDGKVVRFNYLTPEDATNTAKLLRKFGLNYSDLEIYNNTGTAFRYRSKIDGIDDVYILTDEKKTSLVRVTYDMTYFQ